jgi:uncharacterized protein (TIGR02001 family)
MLALSVSLTGFAEEQGIEDALPKGWGEVSATATIATDYIYRGVSQTDELAAVQASMDYSNEFKGVGIYLGAWGSTLNFLDGDRGYVEFDFYGGFTYDLGPVSTDLGVLYYFYPGTDGDGLGYNFIEIPLALGMTFLDDSLELTAGLAWSPDFFGNFNDSLWIPVGLAYTIPGEIPLSPGISANYGRQEFLKAAFEDESYNAWDAGLTGRLIGFDLDLRYYQSDADLGDIAEQRVVFAVSRTF